jgi:transcriptional regulator with XRE-family HTH domain
MNVPALLLTLRKRDRDIAQSMGIKVAQLNRWQKKIQEPSDESFVKIREFVESHISELQKFLDGTIEKTTPVEEVAIKEPEPIIEEVEEPELEVEQEPVKKPKVTRKNIRKWGK